MAIAAAVPWKEILRAVPYLVDGAKTVLKLASKPKEPPIDPAADLRTQLGTLAERVQENENAQTEQAKVVALLAEQLQAIARRSARGYWLAVTGLGLSIVALAISLIRT